MLHGRCPLRGLFASILQILPVLNSTNKDKQLMHLSRSFRVPCLFVAIFKRAQPIRLSVAIPPSSTRCRPEMCHRVTTNSWVLKVSMFLGTSELNVFECHLHAAWKGASGSGVSSFTLGAWPLCCQPTTPCLRTALGDHLPTARGRVVQ